jgi:PAS domain S-box-containing protein
MQQKRAAVIVLSNTKRFKTKPTEMEVEINSKTWKILLVEDDEDDYILTQDMLLEAKGSQFELSWESTYNGALETLQGNHPDVILVDYYLDSRNGLDFVREALEMGCKAPLIVLTGHGSYEVDIQAMQVGAVDYLVKGQINASLLERTIRYAIERKQAEDALQRARDELEMRVQERTQELAQANIDLRGEIAERQRAEKAVRESEAKFRQLAETTSTAIFIVQEMRIRYANSAAKYITGFTPDELVEMEFWQIAHPNYQAALKKRGISSIRDEQLGIQIPMRYELKLLTKDGKERWIDLTAGDFEFEGRPAFVVTAFDITERDLAEQALRKAKEELEIRVAERTYELRETNQRLQVELAERERSVQERERLLVEVEKEHLRVEQYAKERDQLLLRLEAEQAKLHAIIENAPEAIVVADEESRIILFNPVAERLYARPVPIGAHFTKHADLMIHYPDGTPYDPRDLPLTRSALDGERIDNIELLIHWPDGQQRSLLSSSAPILDKAGTIKGAVAIFQDITERKQAEEEIYQKTAHIEVQHRLMQYREMERLYIAQELHDSTLQELIGMDIHLQQALGSMNSLPLETESVLSYLREMQQVLKGQIKDLRAFCSELRPPALIPYGLEKAIRSHADTFQEKHPHIKLELNLMPDQLALPEQVRLALFRIYQELLNNIVKHANASEVLVQFSIDGKQAKLAVKDNGRGFEVPGEWISMARRGHLGLVGIRERADAVGGSSKISSYPGQGTQVQVAIPLNSEPA